jgi:hypothetical protein
LVKVLGNIIPANNVNITNTLDSNQTVMSYQYALKKNLNFKFGGIGYFYVGEKFLVCQCVADRILMEYNEFLGGIQKVEIDLSKHLHILNGLSFT